MRKTDKWTGCLFFLVLNIPFFLCYDECEYSGVDAAAAMSYAYK